MKGFLTCTGTRYLWRDKLYFDERPKSVRKDLFDREEELRQLDAALQRRDPLIIIYGLRRVGKTSLIQTATYDLERHSFRQGRRM